MLNEQNLSIKEAARRFASAELAPFGREWDRVGRCPDDVVRRMGELGFLGMLIPQEYGGAGASFLAYMLALEEVAGGNAGLSTLMHVHGLGVARSLSIHGTEAQKEAWLPRMATGEAIGAFCLTELHAGSDPASIRTRAVKSDSGWRISGTKQFITNGARAKLAMVVAVTDPAAGKRGISAFLVDTGSAGFSVAHIEEKMGQATSDTAQLVFDDVEVDDDAVFGKLNNALPMSLSMLADGRASVAAQAIGIAQAAFDQALAYSKERVAFGKPLIEHQAMAFRLADMATGIELARTFAHRVAEMLDAGVNCLKEASMAKLYACEMAEKVCSDAMHVHGGYGYTKDLALERFYRDVRVCQIYEGTSDVQRMVIARQLG